MCPVCAASAAWVISGVVSTGGVSTFAVKIFRSKKGDSSPRRNDDGNSNDRQTDRENSDASGMAGRAA